MSFTKSRRRLLCNLIHISVICYMYTKILHFFMCPLSGTFVFVLHLFPYYHFFVALLSCLPCIFVRSSSFLYQIVFAFFFRYFCHYFHLSLLICALVCVKYIENKGFKSMMVVLLFKVQKKNKVLLFLPFSLILNLLFALKNFLHFQWYLSHFE